VSKPVRGIGCSVMGQKKKCNRKECVEMCNLCITLDGVTSEKTATMGT